MNLLGTVILGQTLASIPPAVGRQLAALHFIQRMPYILIHGTPFNWVFDLSFAFILSYYYSVMSSLNIYVYALSVSGKR
jgi:hypothetical protein